MLIYIMKNIEKHNSLYAPIGRFGWKTKRFYSDNNNFNNLRLEADKFRENWEPLKAGFFGNSYERFTKIFDEFKSWLDKLAW
jgi:hypothetical protein